ncbi:MAG: lipopolysaccharide biosynthesis protein [Thermoplasmata archaeon]
MSLREKTVKNVAWVFVLRAGTYLLSLVTSVVLARLLFPEDYGIVSLAMVFISGGEIFGDFGLGSAIIQKQKDDVERELYTGATLRLIFATLIYICIFAIAPFVAYFFGVPALVWVIRVSAIQLFLTSAGFVVNVRLTRELKFNKIVVANLSGGLSKSIFVIALAFMGLRYWSVVFGNLAGSLITVLVLYSFVSWKVKFVFDKKIGWELIHFGKYVFAVSVLTWIVFSVDKFVVGNVCGVSILGAYQLAWTWGISVPGIVTSVLGTVLFPTYSRIAMDKEKLKRGYLEAIKYISLVSFPIGFGLMFLAPWFVRFVLAGGTTKWDTAVLPLIVLAGYGFMISATSPAGAIYIACGTPKINFVQTAVCAGVILILVFPLTFLFGAVGTALAFFLPLPLAIWIFYNVTKLLPVTLGEVGKMMIIPAASSVCAVPFCYVPLLFLSPSLFTFLCQALLLLIAYSGFVHLFSKGELTKGFIALVKTTVRFQKQ